MYFCTQKHKHMGHKCYISFKTEDSWYKREIQKWSANEKVDMIDKSLNTPILKTKTILCEKSEKIICLIQRLQSS